MPGAHRGEKELDLLGLELDIVVSCRSVGAGNQTWDLCKNSLFSSPAPRTLVKGPKKIFHVCDEAIIHVSEVGWV